MKVIVSAAVKTDDGVIHSMPPPNRHHNIVHALHEANGGRKIIIARGEQGFLKWDGTFLDRIEAGKLAIECGQIAKLSHPPRLYSEDLW